MRLSPPSSSLPYDAARPSTPSRAHVITASRTPHASSHPPASSSARAGSLGTGGPAKYLAAAHSPANADGEAEVSSKLHLVGAKDKGKRPASRPDGTPTQGQTSGSATTSKLRKTASTKSRHRPADIPTWVLATALAAAERPNAPHFAPKDKGEAPQVARPLRPLRVAWNKGRSWDSDYVPKKVLPHRIGPDGQLLPRKKRVDMKPNRGSFKPGHTPWNRRKREE